jgi:hypothetical protein
MAYKYFRTHRKSQYIQRDLREAKETISGLVDRVDRLGSYRMVFLHHSVGLEILNEGGLKDLLAEAGVAVRSATYGDQIGAMTDIRDWLPKFRNDFDRILGFKSHTDIYYDDGTTNDIIMFKSCFPNSDISSEGTGEGDPAGRERSIVNYKAIFAGLREEMAKAPDKMFIYMTAPPLVPESTSAENASRARQFNAWVVNEYLPSYTDETGVSNLFVFDLFGLLADEEGYLKSDFRKERHGDSHPNAAANRLVAGEFMRQFRPWLQQWESEKVVNAT